MTKDELIQLIQKADGDTDVVIDHDSNGFYEIEKAEILIGLDGSEILNLVTNNEC